MWRLAESVKACGLNNFWIFSIFWVSIAVYNDYQVNIHSYTTRVGIISENPLSFSRAISSGSNVKLFGGDFYKWNFFTLIQLLISRIDKR